MNLHGNIPSILSQFTQVIFHIFVLHPVFFDDGFAFVQNTAFCDFSKFLFCCSNEIFISKMAVLFFRTLRRMFDFIALADVCSGIINKSFLRFQNFCFFSYPYTFCFLSFHEPSAVMPRIVYSHSTQIFILVYECFTKANIGHVQRGFFPYFLLIAT